MIDYHTNKKYQYSESKSKYALIHKFKDIKQKLIRYHVEQLVGNPSYAKHTSPLHELLKI